MSPSAFGRRVAQLCSEEEREACELAPEGTNYKKHFPVIFNAALLYLFLDTCICMTLSRASVITLCLYVASIIMFGARMIPLGRFAPSSKW